eukprot:806391_1
MGCLWSKHYNFEDYHKTFVFGQSLTHNVLRRAVRSIIERCVVDDSIDYNMFLKYVDLFRIFLVIHHEQEDRFIFPKARILMKDETLLAKQEEDHKKLEPLLVHLKNLCLTKEPRDNTLIHEISTTCQRI